MAGHPALAQAAAQPAAPGTGLGDLVANLVVGALFTVASQAAAVAPEIALFGAAIAIVILRTGILPRWIGASGAVLAVGIAAGLVEPAGWELGGTINTLSYIVWALWLITIGVILLIRRARPALAEDRAQVRAPVPVQ